MTPPYLRECQRIRPRNRFGWRRWGPALIGIIGGLLVWAVILAILKTLLKP